MDYAIEFTSFSSDQPVQINISISYLSASMSAIKISNDSIKSIQGFNIASCNSKNVLLSYLPTNLKKSMIVDCNFDSIIALNAIYYDAKAQFISFESLSFEFCTFKNWSCNCINLNSISKSSEIVSICNCSFDKCKVTYIKTIAILASQSSDSIKLNIIINLENVEMILNIHVILFLYLAIYLILIHR